MLHPLEPPRLADFRHVVMDKDDATWCYYRYVGDGEVLPRRPSHAIRTACCQAALFEIIHDNLDLYCGLRGKATAERILALYRRYIDWKKDLPAVVKNIDVNDQPLPHILYLQYTVLASFLLQSC